MGLSFLLPMLYLNLLVQIATVISVLCAAATIWSSVQISKRQMNMEVFTTYSDRYEKIMSGFPENAFRARFSLDTDLPPASDQLSLCVLRYLNLCSEEYYLWRKNYLDEEVWKIWEREMTRMLRSPLVRSEWPELESEFVTYPEFLEFVRKCQSQA